MRFTRAIIIFGIFILGACSSKDTSNTASPGRISPTYAGPPEAAYCAASISYPGTTVTVSGTAQYIRRETFRFPPASPSFEGLGSSSITHGTLPAGAHAIRAAEIRVTDAAGNVIQCGQTSPVDGSFSLVLPAGAVTYKLSVNSRSAQFNGGNVYMNASVLNKPEANTFYSLVTNVSAAGGNVALGTIAATAVTSGPMLGAAFNILDQIFSANAYLRSKTSTCSASFAGCSNVTLTSPVRKVTAYWEKGFNPNDYFGSTSGLSFYLPDYYRLFILGGITGAIDDADTDHFDNSVILHEYGHFLENAMFMSDSPGGSHNGNKVIDPRLAWSEGWGNFIQAAVLSDNGTMTGVPRYYDSSGNFDGVADLFFAVDLENMSGTDVVTGGQGEGNFREFSVSRFLLDVVDGFSVSEGSYPAGSDNISDRFVEVWAALTKATGRGFRDGALAFRNIGNMHIAQQALTAPSNFSAIRTGNYHRGTNEDYAQYVTPGVCTGLNYSIDPTVAASGLAASNLFLDNDFYHLKIGAPGTFTLTLTYEDGDGSGQEADLDLYLYNESAQFGTAADIVAKSTLDPDNNPATQQTETFSVALGAGNYLINVNAYTGGTYNTAGATQYSVKLNGVNLCPDNL